jgi:hypothetical protein
MRRGSSTLNSGLSTPSRRIRRAPSDEFGE